MTIPQTPHEQSPQDLAVAKVIYSQEEHGLSADLFNPEAVNLCQTLQQAGFETYIVGGGVRDALLNLHPKDLDIATSATPEEIKNLFSRCILIGRRFRLAHVYLGRYVFEVATFRGTHSETDTQEDSQENAHGMITRDNVYGNMAQDALRRDFTINALYYNPTTNEVIDYTSGFLDLQESRVQTIGDPAVRFTEDPVRMLRAVRIACKSGFDIPDEIFQAIADKRLLLKLVSKARLFEEYKKMFLTGYSVPVFEQLTRHQLLDILFPTTVFYLNDPPHYDFILQSLKNTDSRVREDKPVNPAFLIAVFLWPRYNHIQQHYKEHREKADDFNPETVMSDVLSSQRLMMSIPRHLSQTVRDIWQLQPVLEARKAKQILRTISNKRFRAAYDFMALREKLNQLQPGLVEWWTHIQTLPFEDQKTKIQELTGQNPSSSKKKKRKKRPRIKPDTAL
jgi:poly(A) polymerase